MTLSLVQTELTTSPERAAEIIRRGGVTAFPTETVYGLGANVFDGSAVAKIFEAKMRPADNPLIAHVGSLSEIDMLSPEIPVAARTFIDRFFPGPLTVVLKRSPRVPLAATAGLETIGVRMPSHELARRFLAACGTPVVAPSANLSGRPSPTTWQAVYEDLNGRIDCILQGEATRIGLESTVVDCSGEVPVLLRPGAVSLEELREAVPATQAGPGTPEVFRSPGLRHRHYSPKARVVILSDVRELTDDPDAAYIGLGRPAAKLGFTRIVSGEEEYARELFEFYRECDRRSIRTIYCERVKDHGLGSALMDRLRRAAQG